MPSLTFRELVAEPMPTLSRFLTACAVVAIAAYVAVFLLATLVEPREREISVRIPTDRLLAE